MIVRSLVAGGVVAMAIGAPWAAAAQLDAQLDGPGGVPTDPVGAIPDDPVARSLREASDDDAGGALWVGAVTGVVGVAGFAYSMRRPRRA